MSFEFRDAKRVGAPLLIGLAGGTGSGKTYSALRLARGLSDGQPFAVIDTENGRALHYADFFPEMKHGDLREPFSPAHYTEAILAADAAGFPVVVVDSASHIWEGEGGVLRMQEEEFKKLGGYDGVKMLSWAAPKQAHKQFVNKLLQVRAHVILCMRAEDKIEMVDDPDKPGKKKVVPKPSQTGLDGWIPICEKRLPFELTLSFLLTSADPGIPKPIKLQEQHKAFFPLDQQVGEETGKALRGWAAGGAAAAVAHPQNADTTDDPTELQLKKLDVLVGTLRKAGYITTEQLYRAMDADGEDEWPRDDEGNLDLHWSPLRDSLTKQEASALIERLVRLEERVAAGASA